MTTGRDVLGALVRVAGRRTMPQPGDYEYVLDAAMSAWRRKLRARRRRRWALALAATVVAGAVGVATFLHWAPRRAASVVATVVVVHGNAAIRSSGDNAWRPLQVAAEIAPDSRLRTGASAGLALELQGGVSARLDKQSELEIESGRALRLITGTVYVDSGPAHASGALRVDTALGTVSDVGTVFQVSARPDALRIQVREGRVQLDAARHSVRFRSAAGEELELDEHGNVRRSAFPATHPAWTWAEALAAVPNVEGRPLLQFLAWVARETGRRLRFQGSDVEAQAREVVLHGQTRDLAPLQALDLMLSTTDLEYVLSADEAIVIRRRQTRSLSE